MLKKRVLAITPARGGSKGIPKKNIKDFCGHPLVAHTIMCAKQSKRITDYIVNSDDDEIRGVAEAYGALTMGRPDKYSHDQNLQEVDLLLRWTVEKYEEENSVAIDIVVLLYPTAPLRDVQSVDEAIELVESKGFDSALSLYRDTRYLWEVSDGGAVIPTNYDPNNRMPRQKENWNQWAENKAIYVMTREVLFTRGRIGAKCGCVEMAKIKSIDIDEPDDFDLAQVIFGLSRT